MSISSVANNRSTVYIGAGLGVTMIAGGLSYLYYKYIKRDVMPLKWRRIGTLDQINIFPVKSCAPLKLSDNDEVFCETLGLQYRGVRDRALMLINENNEMITARIYPKMVLIQVMAIDDAKLCFNFDGMESLELDFSKLVEEAPGKDVHTSVWGTKIDAMLCGEKYDSWFSRCILQKESGLRLVYYPYPKPVRSTNARMAKEPFIKQEDSGTFGDATSYMLMNLASVEDLREKMNKFVDPLQFRGNFHLHMDKDEPYAEDNWQWIRIGENAVFRIVAPCTRCIFPNINVTTGERDPNGDPLKTLKSYRMFKNYASPALGVHLGLRRAGVIKNNDVIYVEDNSP
ncbi:mitochondrial amidoxime-reducing component 1 [Musca vetustissima]|uniref:mitochondrial amidoxime-reducing component 1 n=1 Tax=Musca vetustissima TaxID=27455 RepID=UPI002AB6DE02|nr:mitochondrial amidoxime-reducing component 1 [Musca vetustissima]